MAEIVDEKKQKEEIPQTPATLLQDDRGTTERKQLKILDEKEGEIQNNDVLKSPSVIQEVKIENGENDKIESIVVAKEEKIDENTIPGASFTIANICLGSSIFTFGVRAGQMGLIWTLLGSVICAFVNYWTISRQLRAAEIMKQNDLSHLVEVVLGKKVKLVFDIMLIIYLYGIILSFICITYALIGRFTYSIGFRSVYATWEAFNSAKWGKIKYKLIILAIGLLLIGLSLPQDVSFLNPMSYVAVISVLFTLVVVTIQCHDYYNEYKRKRDSGLAEYAEYTDLNLIDITKSFTKSLEFFKGMATMFFMYSCNMGVFPIYKSFQVQDKATGLKKVQTSIIIGMTMVTFLFILCCTTSYLTEPIHPTDLIIYRVCKDEDSKDILMNIAKIAVAISIIVSAPPNYYPLRVCVKNSFKGGQMSTLFNVIFTVVSMIVCCLITILYDKILNYLSYLGGFFAVFVSYFFPMLIWVKTNGHPMTYWKNIIEFGGAILLTVIGLIAGIMTIVSDVKGE